jgi:hypothetical protein
MAGLSADLAEMKCQGPLDIYVRDSQVKGGPVHLTPGQMAVLHDPSNPHFLFFSSSVSQLNGLYLLEGK